jgi:DNA-binding FrmR family transcriptional regulator
MTHDSHPALIKRLKRAHGHLASVIAMIEAQRPCAEIAQQLFAVESAVTNAKRELIHDHLEHCLTDGPDGQASTATLAEFKDLAKYL